jgi:outer membrane protein
VQKVNSLFVLLVASIAFTPAIVAAAEKIAVIDFAGAIFASDAAQQRAKDASEGSDFVALKAKYEGSAADFQALAKEAESKRLTWSQEQAADHQKKMEYAKADAELAGRKIKAEQQQLQQKIYQELLPKAQEALETVIKEEGITILLKAESLVMASPESNVTAKVVDRLNKNPSQ